MFVKEYYPIEEENTMAAFKRFADGETITKQQRMQNNIDAYTKTKAKPKIAVRMKSYFPVTRKAPRKSKKGAKKSARKMVIVEPGKRVEKYDLINNLAQAQADITSAILLAEKLISQRMNCRRSCPARLVGPLLTSREKMKFMEYRFLNIFWFEYKCILNLRWHCSTRMLYRTLCHTRC